MSAAGPDDPRLWWLADESVAGLRAQLDRLGPADVVPPPVGGTVRLGIVDPDERKLRLARRLLAEGAPWHGRGDVWHDPVGLARAGRVAFLFPGVEPAFDIASVDLTELGRRLGLPAPAVADDTIAHRSASIVTLGIYLDRVMRRLGVVPGVVAGHSIGEWAGSVAAGIVPDDHADDLLDAVDLSAVELPDLDFAAFAAGVDAVRPVVDELDDVAVSHDNAPNQSIVCGRPPVVEQVISRMRDRGVLGYRLGFQSGFHTPAMAEGLGAFRAHLERMGVTAATVPLWSATTVAPYPAVRREIIELHLRHLTEPVRFRPVVEALYHEVGVRVFVQMGLGSLTGFVNDTLGGLDHAAVPLLAAKRRPLAQLHRALTALWVEGLDVSPDALRRPLGPQPGDQRGHGRAGPAAPAPTTAVALAPSAPLPDPRPAGARSPAGSGTEAPAVPLSLAGAAETLGTAARAGHDVLAALIARLHPVASPGGTPAAAAPAGRLDLAVGPAGDPAASAGGSASATAVLAPPAPAPARLSVAAPAPPSASPPGASPLPPRTAPPGPVEPRAPAAATPTRRRASAGPGIVGTTDDRPPGPWGSPPRGLPWPAGKTTIVRRLSLETMPETLDHTLYETPDGWPDVYDRFPIVAMTTQLQLVEDIAADYAGGRAVVELFGVRNFRWLDISDPLDLEITIVPKGDDVLAISLGPYCRANVRVGRYPAAPRYDDPPLVAPRPTVHTAGEMFDQRLMFHGPRFQGITAMGPVGDDGLLGHFTHLETPGSLLDNLGKLIAYWAIDRGGIGEAALPTGVAAVEHFGPLPAPGTPVRCDIRVVDLQRDLIKADGALVLPDGSVLSRVRGWTSILFHLDELMEPVHHGAGRNDVAEPQPGGWVSVRERWPTGQARDLTSRRFLSRAERPAYDGLNLLEQRRWLIDVIAAKDAYRHWLRDRFGVECYPFEVRLVADGDRRYRVECGRTPAGHDPRLTVWSFNWMAVAILGDGAYRDIEAREIPDGADPGEIAHRVAESVASHNPGVEVASVAGPVNVVPCRLGIPDPPPYAVAWTADGDVWPYGTRARPDVARS